MSDGSGRHKTYPFFSVAMHVRFGGRWVWQHIEKLLVINRSGSIFIQEIITIGGEESELELGRAELILTGCWYIWCQRRQLVHGEKIQNPSRSAMSIAAITTNYFIASKKGAVINQGWRKPSRGYLMINIDGAFDEIKGSGSSGAIIRDSGGAFIATSHSYIPHVLDAASSEAAALRDGLLLAQQIGCNRVVIQSDCMEVVQTMHNGGFSATAAVAIYDEIVLLWKEFSEISIIHCNRLCNSVAHELARQALLQKSS
jgi:ribonuclease HI